VNDECKKDEETPKCLEKQITDTLKSKGLDAAFEKMGKLYETSSLFRETCHSNAHILGDAAYDLFKKGKMPALSPKTSYCGYGFYHGFMEKMLQTTGSLEEAQTFCKKAGELLAKETSDAEGACYHGIGHGSMDGGDPTLWGNVQAMIEPSIKLCEKVAPENEYQGKRYRCMTGVYNAIEILSQNSQYGLDLLRKDPFGFCPTQPIQYQEGCYTNMLPALMRKVGGSYEKAIAEIIKIPKGTQQDPIRSLVFSSLMHDYIREFINSNDLYGRGIKTCRSVNEDMRIPCFEGLSGGLMKYGEPQKEYIKALNFCASPLLKADESGACYKYIIPRFRIWYSIEKIQQICSTIPDPYKSYCH
jgi:hypothetical protein